MIDPNVIVQLLRSEGETVIVHDTPELIEDVDGMPLGITPGRSKTAVLGSVALTGDEWETVARHLLALLDGRTRDA